MGREKALFVVNSVYQLLTAVHLRRCLPEGWEGELLLTDLLPEHQALACRGRRLGSSPACCWARPGSSRRGAI